jgi:hypothetical protein
MISYAVSDTISVSEPPAACIHDPWGLVRLLAIKNIIRTGAKATGYGMTTLECKRVSSDNLTLSHYLVVRLVE